MNDSPKILRSTQRFAGRVFAVRSDEVRYADGTDHTFDVVEHRGSVAIVATTPEQHLVLVRQYRHPLGRVLWEIPAGMAELGEAPLDGARRELAEETGFRAAGMSPLGSLYVTPGFCDEVLHFFRAWDLTTGTADPDEDERIDVAAVPLSEAKRLLAAGEIADVKTALAIAWLELPSGEIPGRSADR